MHAMKSSIAGSILSLSIAWVPAVAGTILLRASLDGAQVPLAVGGTGTGTMTFDTATKVLSWSVTYTGLSGACTDAHFHGPASAGVNNVPTVGMTCSASPLTGSSAALNATQEAQLLSGQWYINIHTGIYPGGEIRGQVVRVRGDLSGDGQSDVLWRNAATGENYLYPLQGTTILGTEGYLRTVADQNWQVAGVGDFDGDGKADVLWRNSSTGENYIYVMNGTAIAGEGYVRTVADQNWEVAGVGDLDGDGKADIVWRNAGTGENYLYPMDGLAIKGSEGYLRTVADQDWRVAGLGDVDGDGRADILWRNSTTGENYLYPMSGTTILGTEGFFRAVADLNWKIVGTGDFNGDGRADILWRNTTTGENYLYPMDGTAILGTEGYLRTVADQNWKVQATGDYDGDGKADVFWRNSSTGENYLYFMDGTAIKPTEGYTRTVADQQWRVPGAVHAGPALSCQQQLQQLNVNFTAGPVNPGVADPVTVQTPLNGVTFTRNAGAQPTQLYVDCSLALALHRATARMIARGIDTVTHLGTYNYRCIGGGTPPDCPGGIIPEHAQARAIDFASFSGGGETYSVLDDWVIDGIVEDTCAATTANAKDALLHDLVCSWFGAGIFNIILTPNYNADHRNHLHFDLTPGAAFIQ